MTNPQETSSFPQYQPHHDSFYTEPETAFVTSADEHSKKRRGGIGPTLAVALVTSLLAGAGAGYAAGVAARSDGGGVAAGEPENALENPSVPNREAAPEGSVEQVAADVLPAVVSIEVGSMRGGEEGSGSIISSDGYVITNHHVIASGQDPAAKIMVTLNDGSRHPASFIASDVNTDIGVIKIEGVENLPVIQFGNSDDLRVGQQVVACLLYTSPSPRDS